MTVEVYFFENPYAGGRKEPLRGIPLASVCGATDTCGLWASNVWRKKKDEDLKEANHRYAKRL